MQQTTITEETRLGSNFIGKALITTLSLGFAAAAQAQTTTFGSNNDGNGGFTTSALAGTEAWNVGADSYNYSFGDTSNPSASGSGPNDEGHIASLLKQFTISNTVGSAYTFEGVVDLVDGYGDDNNRIGIVLFNDTATQSANGGGGLFLRLNADAAKGIAIQDGINGSNGNTFTGVETAPALGTYSGDSWIGTTVTFKADIEYLAGDNLNVNFTFTDQDSVTTSLSATVTASDYSGTYFGFSSKWRQRNTTSANRNAAASFDYKSFSVVPEPSAFAFISGLFAFVWLMLRRRV